MAHPYASARAEHRARAGKVMSSCGYANGGHAEAGESAADERQDKRMIAAAVHKHERHDHKGEPLTKLGSGGRTHLAKRARGGKVTKVQVIVAPQGGGGAQPVPVPVPRPVPVGGPPPGMGAPLPPGAGPGMPPGAGPMAGPPGGMMPPGGMRPPMMRARGGGVPHMTAGGESGPGRLQKMREYGEGGFKPKVRGVKKG